jgi:hypothetical protein
MQREFCRTQNILDYAEVLVQEDLQSLGLHPTPNFDKVFVS